MSPRSLLACLTLAALLDGALAIAADPPQPTALSGLILDTDGRPLANVMLRDGQRGTRTDSQGKFLLTGVAPGDSVLVIDGRHAGPGSKVDYGYFEARVTAAPEGITALPFTSWLPRIDHSHDVTIASPTRSEVVVTTPAIPGLELHIPAGSVITDPDGKPVTKVGITPIPKGRVPFPTPETLVLNFTIQPGGSMITGANGMGGAQLWYPNATHGLPGARVSYVRYDPYNLGWIIYGIGTVDVTGTKIAPDPTAKIPDLR